MTDQTITATPVNAPDILRNQPLSRQVDITLETTILEPTSHRYDSASGGSTTFILPQKGVLDAPNAAIVFELISPEGDQVVGYNLQAGGLGMVRRITARCGGTIISQCELAGHYANLKSHFSSQNVREGVLDSRHISSNRFERRVTPQKIAAGSATTSYHQLYNVEADQCSGFGENNNRNANNTHALQRSKRLSNVAGRGPEVVIKLADLFEIFAENKLPLMAMAQTEIEIEWEKCGDPNVAAAAQVDNVLIQADIPNSNLNANSARGQRGTATMTTPNMILDYIHYDDVERQKIYDAVNTQGGMRLDFTEVLITRGVNPAGTANPGGLGAETYEVVESNHIIGMAQKEVKKIYIQKGYDLYSARGTTEINADYPGAIGAKNHRNIVLNQFKSTQIPGEKYNWFINNQRIYNRDIDNPAVAHNYLSQCGGNWSVPQTYYDTMTYNPTALDQLVSTDVVNAVSTQDANGNSGVTRRYLGGESNVIGLSLDKYREMGSVPGNGTRIGSAPIEFNYSRVSVQASAANGGAGGSSTCEVNLTFYICYRRSLIIRSLGVDVSDS
tara:strand:+ start:208 stop:1884 length:1677 start_codon:yes stop_codon:yes gene_type:complete